MRLIGAIDLLEGRCVRLLRGDKATAKLYFENPQDALLGLERAGADGIHVVDLGAAFGGKRNSSQMFGLLKSASLPVQVGGGIRSAAIARELLEAGAERVVLSTLLSESPDVVRTMCAEFGCERVAAAIDERDGKALSRGWTCGAGTTEEIAELASAVGAGMLIYTNISRDGALDGLDEPSLRRFISSVKLPVIVGGGVSSAEDAVKAARAGAYGMIVGRAFYEGEFDFMEARKCLRKD